jgi:hypothetical protein
MLIIEVSRKTNLRLTKQGYSGAAPFEGIQSPREAIWNYG